MAWKAFFLVACFGIGAGSFGFGQVVSRTELAAKSLAPDVTRIWPLDAPVDSRLLVRRQPDDRSRQLLQQLMAEEFATRNAAAKKLADGGIDAFPGLLDLLATSNDLEVKSRIEELWGTLETSRQLPVRVERAIAIATAVNNNAVVPADNRGFDARTMMGVALDTIAHMEDREQFVRATENLQAARPLLPQWRTILAPVTARKAIIRGDWEEAERLLRSSGIDFKTKNFDYVALAAMRRGEALDPTAELQALQIRPQNMQYAKASIVLYRAKPELDTVSRIAEQLIQKDSRLPLSVYDSWDWAEPYWVEARDLQRLGKTLPSNSKQFVSRFRVLSILFLDDTKSLDAIVRDAVSRSDREMDDDILAFSSRVLMEAGRVDEAVRIASRIKDSRRWQACHWLISRWRTREAMAMLEGARADLPLDIVDHLIELGLFDAARKVLVGIGAEMQREVSCVRRLNYAGQLERVGELNEAKAIRDAALKQIAAEQEIATNAKLAHARVSFLSRQNPQDENELELARIANGEAFQRLNALGRDPNELSFASDPSLPDDEARRRAQTWLGVMSQDNLEIAAKYDLIKRIMKGELKEGEARLLNNRLVERYPPGQGMLAEIESAARDYHAMGRDEWARDLVLQWMAREKDPRCFAILGDFALEARKPETAVLFYMRAAANCVTDASLMYRTGKALSLGTIAPEAGKRLMTLAPHLVLADLEQERAYADALRRFEGDGLANTWLDEHQSRFGLPGNQQAGERFVRARDLAISRADYATAVLYQQQVLFCLPEMLTKDLSNGTKGFADYYRLRALAAFARHDMAAMATALERQLDHGSPDVELLERVIPALRRSDTIAAERVLKRAEDRVKSLVREYPKAERYRAILEKLLALAR